MRQVFFIAALLFMTQLQAQYDGKGRIVGTLTDEEQAGEPLPFANILIKHTTMGATTDFDGNFAFDNIPPGSYTLVFSFIGYQSLEITDVEVDDGGTVELYPKLSPSAAALDEVLIKVVTRRDTEVALLTGQKRAVNIVGSIGAQELAKLGVSDVAAATTKIAGVSGSEASGDIYVRGLGDRYLSSSLNGLPVPSDDVERKNIDLGLFSTSLLQDVSISKTFSAEHSADQASGNVDISTRSLHGPSELTLGVEAGFNTNVLADGVADRFRLSANAKDAQLGFYSKPMSNENALSQQTWSPQGVELPMNYKYSLSAGKRFGEKLGVLFTGSQSSSFEYREGLFREFRSNYINDSFSDAEEFSKETTTTGLLDLTYELDEHHELRATSLFINRLSDEVYEAGRNGEGYIRDETQASEELSQFVRDQNLKQTRISVNQLAGEHELNDSNTLNWAAGYNIVDASEPNRIRNEVNFNDAMVQLARTGGYQQRKSSQRIEEREINAFIEDKMLFRDTLDRQVFLDFGADFRNKERRFQSEFFGVEERFTNTFNPGSIDNLSSIFTPDNFANGSLVTRGMDADLYKANLNSFGGYASFNYGISKWNFNLGLRYQVDEIGVDFNVGNYPGRTGEAIKKYQNLYPALNVKYALDARQNLRLAASRTISLPEFKEIAPFEYVSPTGQITRGNPDLEASTNYNLDLKWEFFPTSSQLVSLTGFYKQIENPINRVQDRGSAGVYSYFNSGEQAEIYGLEADARVQLLGAEEGAAFELDLNLNATRMWHSQDLKEELAADGSLLRTFRYNGISETGLEGASDWIFNGALSFETNEEYPWMASIAAMYASDKIYALGAPEIQTESEVFYNAAIVEEGFVSLDALIGKNFDEHWRFELVGENLLNPQIERTQLVRPSTTGMETNQTVRSYSKGSIISLGISYKF